MKIVYPLTFKFGELGVEKISKDDIDYYHFLATAVLKSSKIRWANDADKSLPDLFVTTPISKKALTESPNLISQLFIEWCTETAKIFEAGVISVANAVVLINIQGRGRHKQFGHLSNTLVHMLTYESKFRIILLVNHLPQKEDIQFEPLMPYIKKKILCIIDKSGAVYDNRMKIEIDSNKLIELNQKRVPLSYDLIRNRIVRRIGHFKVKDHDEHCNRYFYDGIYCGEQLQELILDHIFQNFSEPRLLEYIVYSSQFSPWLEKAVSAAIGDITTDYREELPQFRRVLSHEELEAETEAISETGRILLIVDFVNSGKTLQALIETVQAKFSLKNPGHLEIISVLNNEEEDIPNRLSNNKRKIEVNGFFYEFVYFADVRTKTFDSKSDCDCCKIGMDWTNVLDVNHQSEKIKSVDFWFLADLYDYKVEDNVPEIPQREGLELVPKFDDWLPETGTFLAFKLRKFIESYRMSNSIDFTIVFPIEPNKNNVAYLFALKLKELFNLDIVGIPREIIDAVKKESINTTQIRSLSAPWVQEIKRKTTKVDFVILDEFHNKGGTFESIRKVLNTLGNPPKSYFVIADFNPSKSSTYVDDAKSFRVYSLYDFNYN